MSWGLRGLQRTKIHPRSLPGRAEAQPLPTRGREGLQHLLCVPQGHQGLGKGSPGTRQGKVICGYWHPKNDLSSCSERSWAHSGFGVGYHPHFQPCVGWNMSHPSLGLAGRQKLAGICISAVGFKNKSRAG